MRVSTLSIFNRVLLGIRSNQLTGLRAEEQLSSGRRILRPSDDPAGTARSLAMRRELARSTRIQDSIAAGQSQLELGSVTLQHSSELLTRGRELLLQAMNGTLTDQDRGAIATELSEIRKQLLDDANLQVDGGFVFGGTALGQKPWVEVTQGGTTHVVYRGNSAEQTIQAGEDVEVAITAIGNQIFGRAEPGPATFDGLTGIRSGLTADEGSGYATLVLRHDSTDLGALTETGVGLVDGGGQDTFLGASRLVLDGVAGTLRLGNGPAVALPEAGQRGDVVLTNEKGGTVHLDLSAWNGASFDGTVVGAGSASLDGVQFTPVSFDETDLELVDEELGRVLHVNTTGAMRAGKELVTFGHTINPFDLLQGVVDDLRNDQGLDSEELIGRLSNRLDALDGVHDDLLLGLGVVGARSARLTNADARQGELELQLRGRLSEVEDADLSEVALDLARSQMILQVAQSAGARVIQTTLLNFLG